MRVFLCGYYGMHNTGDDALLAVSTWGIRRFLTPETTYVNLSQPPVFSGAEYLTPIYPPLNRFRGENTLRSYVTALRSETVLYGGGSLFHTSSGIRWYINQLRLAGKGPHYAVGVALGPFRTVEDERVCSELLKRFEYIGLRDQESFDIARAIAPNVKSEKTFDLAPLLPRAVGMNLDSVFKGKRAGIGFSLCDFERFSHGDISRDHIRRQKLKETLELIDPAIIDELVFIDFNGHPNFGDRGLHEELSSILDNRFKIRHVPYCPNPIVALREIASLRVVVAMRLHAAVFGYLAKTPTILLSYHPKCNRWSEDIGLNCKYVFDSVDFSPTQLINAITHLLERPEQMDLLSPHEAERMALKNWDHIKSLQPKAP